MLRSRSGKLFAGLTAGVTGAGGYVSAYGDEGTQRSLTFWMNIFPIYAAYRGVLFLNRDTGIIGDQKALEWYDILHERNTDFVKDMTYKLRGFYLKHAQLMSVQDDFVPPQYMKWVKDTQDNVPSEFEGDGAKKYVEELCRSELGLNFDDVFIEWDDKPLGVASIGEVHRAKLKTGETVAVKLLVPDIDRKFRSDIQTLKSFCQLAMPQHVPAFNEIEKQFLTEFDYREEANHLERARLLTVPRWKSTVYIPKPYKQFCSQNLLVMEYLDGVKLVDGIRAQYGRIAAKAGLSLEELEAERKRAIESGVFKFRSIDEEKRASQWTKFLVGLGDVCNYNALRFLYNNSILGWIYGSVPYEWTEVPIDIGSTIELLSRIQSANIFFDGEFNGDAHPGNIMLLRDGRFGLIDYGQVKCMTIEERIVYAKLILALSRDDRDEVVRLYFEEMKAETRYRKPDIAYLFAAFWNDRSTPDVMRDMNVATFIDWLQDNDPMVQMPEEYIFASRASVMLRGMAKAFGIHLRISPLWKHDAEQFLRSQGVQY
jgi:aarF domain-containing kinase